MTLQRISIAMPLVDAAADPESVVPVFHRWISERRLEGLPIDVARYGHVPDGPGVILIGFDGDLALEETGGHASLRFTLKRSQESDVTHQVALATGRLLEAAQELESDTDLRVDRTATTVRISDKLNAPNTDAVRAELVDAVVSGVAATVGYGAPQVTPGSTDPRDPVTWTITGEPALQPA